MDHLGIRPILPPKKLKIKSEYIEKALIKFLIKICYHDCHVILVRIITRHFALLWDRSINLCSIQMTIPFERLLLSKEIESESIKDVLEYLFCHRCHLHCDPFPSADLPCAPFDVVGGRIPGIALTFSSIQKGSFSIKFKQSN